MALFATHEVDSTSGTVFNLRIGLIAYLEHKKVPHNCLIYAGPYSYCFYFVLCFDVIWTSKGPFQYLLSFISPSLSVVGCNVWTRLLVNEYLAIIE